MEERSNIKKLENKRSFSSLSVLQLVFTQVSIKTLLQSFSQTSLKQEIWLLIPKEFKVAFKPSIEASYVSLADSWKIPLYFCFVVHCYAWRNRGVRYQTVYASCFQNVGSIVLQGFMVSNHTVCDFAGGTEFHIGYPVNDVITKLDIQPSVIGVTQIANKILKLQPFGLQAISSVLTNDAGSNFVSVPRLKARIVHKLVFKCRNKSFKWISNNKKLEV